MWSKLRRWLMPAATPWRAAGPGWRDIADCGELIRVVRGPYQWTTFVGGSGMWYLSRVDGEPLPLGERYLAVSPGRVPQAVRDATP